MPQKGNGRRFHIQFCRQADTFSQQSLMAQMYPVKKTQGINSLFHKLILFLEQTFQGVPIL
jgi:hypothetical protein